MNDTFVPYFVALAAFLLGVIAQVPRIDDPIPESIGLGSIFAIAGAGGVVGTIIGELGYRRRKLNKTQRADAARVGLVAGAGAGMFIYLALLVVQVLF